MTLVSVIVTTRNSERTLEACLASIREQTYPNVELITVDNGSSDLTQEIAERFSDAVLQKGPERSAQRNYGVEKSHGNYLLFIDSDMVLEPGVVSDGIDALSDPAVRAVIIPEESFGEGFWAQCKVLERHCYVGEDNVESARMYRRQDFLDVGGFDLELTGPEDWDLTGRIAGRSVRPRTASIIHHDEGRISLRGNFVKRRYYAPGYLGYLVKHRNGALAQGNALFRPAFLRHWRDLAREPAVALGMFVLKFVEFLGVAQVAAELWIFRRKRHRFMQMYHSSGSAPEAPVPADGQGT
jgi:glycosyltransferase involved in cell wall biosynthesis